MATKDISDEQVVLAYAQFRRALNSGSKEVETPEKILSRTTGQPPKVCWSAMERAAGHGLVDYGANLRLGWLTEKGKRVADKIAFGDARPELLPCPFCGCSVSFGGGCNCGKCPSGILHMNDQCILGNRRIGEFTTKPERESLAEAWNERAKGKSNDNP